MTDKTPTPAKPRTPAARKRAGAQKPAAEKAAPRKSAAQKPAAAKPSPAPKAPDAVPPAPAIAASSGRSAAASVASPEAARARAPADIERDVSPAAGAARDRAGAPPAPPGCTVREAAARRGNLGARDIRFAALPDDAPAPIQMRSPEITRRSLEVVIGFDDRARVSPTRDYAWRCICMLRITAADGSQWLGTGWLAGPRLVVTAGHVVHIANRGGWVRQVEVIPGSDGPAAPFGSAVSRRFRSVAGWVGGQQGGHDYGAIILPPEADFGAALGYFGVARLDDGDLAGVAAHVSGYPADKPSGTQWHHARNLLRADPDLLFYDIDTAGGQSGAPVWMMHQGGRYVVGVHRAGEITGNSAVRVTEPVFANIHAWNGEAS